MNNSTHDPDNKKLEQLLLRDAKLKLPAETLSIENEQDPDDVFDKWQDSKVNSSSYSFL